MSIADDFTQFLINIRVKNDEQISQRYGEITSALNKKFRDSESKTSNNLQVGSYGRWTAINGISYLDMLYIVPARDWETYKDNGQKFLLDRAKDAIKSRYPATTMYVDRLVVRVLYKDFHVEVQPVFEQEDGSFKYPDTYKGGSWKITKPREEISAISEFNAQKNKNLRRLCKMVRAWKNKHGVGIGGLLIDTMAHNFLKSTSDYDDKSYLYYDFMSRDFFKWLSERPDQDYFAALGSGQRVRVKDKFQKPAFRAYEMCLLAIAAAGTDREREKWRKVFGNCYPKSEVALAADRLLEEMSSEEFVENIFPVDIKVSLKIDCEVSQNGFRENLLRDVLKKKIPLRANKKLNFFISDINAVDDNFSVYWKVLNRGEEAIRKKCIRGQIVLGGKNKREETTFRGDHIVECYVVKDGIVIGRNKIHVPINPL
jgi:hypothetical protein